MQQKTFDLNSLNGATGFIVPGLASNGLGSSVSTAGDINGDGFSDLVLGAIYANSLAGAGYVIFGSRSGFPASFNLNNLNGANGFTVPGIVASGLLGSSVSTAGDINGDGLSDIVLGAPQGSSYTGASYVIFGNSGGFGAIFNLNTLNGTNGFTVPGITVNNQLGYSIDTAGDVNGDGISDLVLGAPYTNFFLGASYVIFGSRRGFPASFNLNNLNGTNGFIVPGVASQGFLGGSVSIAGDINGDGISDLILGAYQANSLAGASYVIFGSRGGFPSSFNLNNLNGTNGFIVPGVMTGNQGGQLGRSVSTAGDVNGDGLGDLLLGAPGTNGNSYIIFGSQGGFAPTFNLTNLNGTNGFTMLGRYADLGSSAGDINGDGTSDLIFGAPQSGTSYVVFGSSGGFGSPFNIAILNGTNGFSFIVSGLTVNNNLGSSVSPAGDVNGDGFSDLVLGANGANSNAGAAYVIFGSPFVFINNQMTITEGQSVMLTNNQLSVIDFKNPTNNLTFIPHNVQGGRFELVSNPGISITTFTPQQINSNQIRFVSNRTAPVSYAISVADGQFTSPAVAADVTFIDPGPMLINVPPTQMVEINQFFHFTLQAGQIFNDSDGDSLTYFVKLSNGSLLPNWINFDASQPNQLDFNGTAPSAGGTQLSVFAQDPLNVTANTEFEILAKSMWVNNQVTITEGQTVVLTQNDLDATGLNDPATKIFFTVSNLQGGRFEFVSMPGILITTFTQQQINSNEVCLVSDRTAPVAYEVGVTDGQFTLSPVAANVTFIDHAPMVINIPATQVVKVSQPFHFTLQANQIFNDSDGDPLTYSAKLTDGSPLPNWMRFDVLQLNQLNFSGTAPSVGGTQVSLSAQDSLNATANTQFEILTEFGNGTTASNLLNDSSAQIIGSVVGGVLGFGALLGTGFGFWQYVTNKNSRQRERFADYIRDVLKLKEVDNFDHETGQKYVAFVHRLIQSLQQSGIDPAGMRVGELHDLANDVAIAARNKITVATDCLGRSEITVDDLSEKAQELASEVQLLRNYVSSVCPK